MTICGVENGGRVANLLGSAETSEFLPRNAKPAISDEDTLVRTTTCGALSISASSISPHASAMATASTTLMRANVALAKSLVRGCSHRVPGTRWGGFGASRDKNKISQRHGLRRFAAVSGDDTDASTSSTSTSMNVGDKTSETRGGSESTASVTTTPPDVPSVPLGILSSGAVLVPHPDKAEKGGEDACFVLRDNGAFGVMDGVGGWADEGVDPSAYSNQFAERSAAAVLMGALDPKTVIAEAHDRTKVVGSATACVAILDGITASLKIGNLGDAGAMVARNGKNEFNTPSQQHEFNCPFQLGCLEFYPESDGAQDVQSSEVLCQPGDILVMGSDGLWDNVAYAEVAEVCKQCVDDGKDAQATAETIATLAFEHSVDEEYDSPFTKEARNNGYDVEWWEKAKGKVLVGGKMDDIAVVVAFMDAAEKCPEPSNEDEDSSSRTK